MSLPATFEELAAQPDDDLDVATGAALLARDAYPDLDIRALLARFDEMAAPLIQAGGALGALDLQEQAASVSRHVHDVLRFRGNAEDYHDARNSLLPDVLERRLGIPITLSLVYCEIARRAGVRARGVGFPGHYLVRVDAPDGAQGSDEAPVVVDPFHGGRALDTARLEKLLARVSPGARLEPGQHLAPAAPRATLVRMLVNLKWIHATRGDFARALLALDRILCLTPDCAPALRERGLLAARLGSFEVARADLSRLLKIAPQAPDAAMLNARLRELGSKGASLN
jgi:regulator of sirC expression with transglutaminase-like and TPR domain